MLGRAVSPQKNRQIYTEILCTNCVQKIQNNMLFWGPLYWEFLQDIVEAGTGVEPVYTDLQSI